MNRDEKKLDTQFTPNVYFWTPNSKILAKALFLFRFFFWGDTQLYNGNYLLKPVYMYMYMYTCRPKM